MHCSITSEPIDAGRLARLVRTDSDGAVLVFTGVVRNHDDGRSVGGLLYETYEAMAREALERICVEVLEANEVTDIAVEHRVGDLAVGDISVAIAVSAAHRDAAYRASREVIERLKREVPIWKRERYTDGEERWLEGAEPPAPKVS